MAKSVSVVAAALLIAAAPCAVAQHLAVAQQSSITVQVVNTLGVQMPDLPTQCSDCVIRIPLSAKRSLPPKTALNTIFLAQTTDFDSTSGTPSTTKHTVVEPPGSPYALVHVARIGGSGRKILTIELQHY